MKKWYKECPFCKNEIKSNAIKCQYCKEFLDWADDKSMSNIKNENKKSELVKKILYTVVFISFLLLLFWWVNPMMHDIDDRTPEYVNLFRIPMVTYFVSMLWLTIIYCRNRSKLSLIILWINVFLLLGWYLLNKFVKSCNFGYSTTYCYDFGWGDFWWVLILMTIPILIIWFIVYILRLIWWWRKK